MRPRRHTRRRIVGRIRNTASDVAFDSVEQLTHLCRVIGVPFSHDLGNDDARAIDSEVQFLPPPLALAAVLRSGPFAVAHDRESGAVDDLVDRLARRYAAKGDVQALAATGECRVIGCDEVHVHQRQQRVQEPLGLAQR